MFICAEIYVGNRHGYRLLSAERDENGNWKDTFEIKDVPDETVNKLVSVGRISKSFKGKELPVLKGSMVISNRNKYTFIERERDRVVYSDYSGKKIEADISDITSGMFWNGHKVEFIGPGKKLMATVQGVDETYEEIVDAYYRAVDIELHADRLSSMKMKLDMLGTGYSVTDAGELFINQEGSIDTLRIPNGVLKSFRLKGVKHIVGCGTIVELELPKSIQTADLSMCKNLVKVKLPSRINANGIKWSKSITEIAGDFGGTALDTFEDWGALKYTDGMFKFSNVKHLILGNSSAQDYIPRDFASTGSYLQSVIIKGNNISNIEENAFLSCKCLDFVDLGDCDGEIKPHAFASQAWNNPQDFKRLKVIGGSKIKKIGSEAFSYRNDVDIDLRNFCELKFIGARALSHATFDDFYIPDSVTTVGEYIIGRANTVRLGKKLSDKSIEKILALHVDRHLIVPSSLVERLDTIMKKTGKVKKYIIER